MSTSIPAKGAPWLYHPATDLLIGAGLWSIPILIITFYGSTMGIVSISLIFYVLSIFCNNPHYMATVHRAYSAVDDRRRYRTVTVYFTVILFLAAALVHFFPLALPILVTIYLTWSPWHYTAQNYGIMMMFLRRGDTVVPEAGRKLLYLSFLLSYGVWICSMHTDAVSSLYFYSLNIPEELARIGRLLLMASSLGCAAAAFTLFRLPSTWFTVVAASCTFLTQAVWFLIPAVLEFSQAYRLNPAFYATGALAFLHCAQYLWITSYFAKAKHAEPRQYSFWRYYGLMILGGLALFLPGPWFISRVFRQDFVHSFLVFTALVNIHHFILDGAVWKLRDNRVAQFLLGNPSRKGKESVGSAARAENRPRFRRAAYWVAGVALVVLCLMDIANTFATQAEASPGAQRIATMINPYDTRSILQQARYYESVGDFDSAVETLQKAVDLNPLSDAQFALGALRVKMGDIEGAREHYERQGKFLRPDATTLINTGAIHAQRGDLNKAIADWERAARIDPDRPEVALNLAEAYFGQGMFLEAAEQYQRWLDLQGETVDVKTKATVEERLRTALQRAAEVQVK